MPAATQTWSEQSLECAGLTLRYLKGGSGHPVVTLHHSTGSPGWLPLHDALAERAEVYLPDMPGYGQSTRPEWAREPRDLAILLGQAIDKLGLDNVALVGFGFGGFVAAEFATMASPRLSHLVLVGAAGLQPTEGEILDEMMVDFDQYVKAGFRNDELYTQNFGEETAPEMKQLWDFSREMTARLTWKPYMFNRRLAPLLAEVAKSSDRVVLIEDTRELQCAAQNLVALRTKDGVATLSDLVRSSLRLRPDRIPIGEVRGAEALDLLKAWGTG
ncbi:Flp pilus assembly complex ATPase component TadA, partial [bacterium]|nr:Flp pilus assembly complex ATPase component TadA [bacterium]